MHHRLRTLMLLAIIAALAIGWAIDRARFQRVSQERLERALEEWNTSAQVDLDQARAAEWAKKLAQPVGERRVASERVTSSFGPGQPENVEITYSDGAVHNITRMAPGDPLQNVPVLGRSGKGKSPP